MQSAVLFDESTVKEVAAVKTIPEEKFHCIEVFASIALGPIRAVVTAPAVSPSPIVMLCAPAPLLMVKWSTMIEIPAAGAALSSSHPLASALVAFRINPNLLGAGVVTDIAMMSHPLIKAGRHEPPGCLCYRAAIVTTGLGVAPCSG